MKIKIWTRITDRGDGSSSTKLYPSEFLAREGLDDEGFEVYEDGTTEEVPCEIDYTTIETAGCEIVR